MLVVGRWLPQGISNALGPIERNARLLLATSTGPVDDGCCCTFLAIHPRHSFLYQLSVEFVNPIELYRDRAQHLHEVALERHLQVVACQERQHVSRLTVNFVLLSEVVAELGYFKEAGDFRS